MRLAAFLCPLLLLTGCVHYDLRETSETRTVEAGGAESARVQVEMAAGELRIQGGATKLLDADFRYNVPDWKPVVRYDVTAGRGYLTVRQPEVRGIGFGGDHRNRWELELSDKIPMDLRVKLGAGQSILRLSGMSVRRLEVEMGAGDLSLDLTGPWDQNLDAHISGGVGQATVRLPRGVGVRVKATGGLGSIHADGLRQSHGYYVNDAYEQSPVTLRVDVSGGIGQINLIGG